MQHSKQKLLSPYVRFLQHRSQTQAIAPLLHLALRSSAPLNILNGPMAQWTLTTSIVSSRAKIALPGPSVEVQQDANTLAYNIPPDTALSRIMLLSKTSDGSTEPASASVVWLLRLRRRQTDIQSPPRHTAHVGPSVSAPSHYHVLIYQIAAPYELALQGYVVVPPDYARIDVYSDISGKF